jgi:hypothetical protein
MKSLSSTCSTAGLILALAGCAGITVERQTDKNSGDDGIRFYRPAPYLFQTATKDGCSTAIIYLPDMSQEWIAVIHRGLGSAKSSLDLQDGWNLTSLNAESDSKIPETITALAGVAKLAIPGAATPQIQGGKAQPPACSTVLQPLHWREGSWVP